MFASPASPESPTEVGVHTDVTGALDVTAVALGFSNVSVQLQGEMDSCNVDLLTAVIDNQLSLGRRFIRLDLSRLTFLDCAGLRAIVEAHNRCLAVRGTLVLTGVTPRIARLLAITHLDEALLLADGPGEPRHVRREHHLTAVSGP